MIKGNYKVKKILNKYLKKFNAKAVLDTRFEVVLDKNIIGYCYVLASKSDELFTDFCSSLNSRVAADPFLTAFFHEIGHIMTLDDIDADDETYCTIRSRELAEELSHYKTTDPKYEELSLEYFNLPMEKAATAWALNYMEENAEEVGQLWRELQPAILKVYSRNNVIRENRMREYKANRKYCEENT